MYFHLSLTHWGWDKMAAISQTTFSSTFSWMKMFEFRLKFHWSMLLKGLNDNILALVQIMAWRRPGDKPLSEPMMFSLLTHICVTRPQWVNNGMAYLVEILSHRRQGSGNHYIEQLVQERCNFIANALELCLSCTNLSISNLKDRKYIKNKSAGRQQYPWWLLRAEGN